MITKISIYLIVFLLLFLFYRLLLRNTGYFLTNRIILLLIPVVSLIVPFIHFETSAGVGGMVVLPEYRVGIENMIEERFTGADYLRFIWLIGASVAFGFFLPRLIWSLRQTESSSGYAFFSRFYINEKLDPALLNAIKDHENVHISRGHSFDIIVMEIWRILFWFNPLMHLLIREVRLNHEFEADRVASEKNKEYSKMLVSQHFKVDHRLLGHSFSMSKLKKRLIMIQKEKSPKALRRYGIFTLLTLGTFALVSWRTPVNRVISDGFASIPPKQSVEIGEPENEPDKYPHFQGGPDAMYEYMGKNVKYPKEAKEKGIEGKVFVSFVVSATGKIKNVQVKKTENEIFNASALEAVKGMPDWVPGEKDGKKVSCEMVLPIVYKL